MRKRIATGDSLPLLRRVAVARAMLKTIYAMLKNQETLRPIVKGTTGQLLGVMAG